jgi:plastocyanin
MRRWIEVMIVGAAAAGLFIACGKGPTEPSAPPMATNTITITAAGVNPRTIVVAVGSQVTFVNNDSRSHDMQSDPHPEHNDCPELASVGFLKPGERRQSGNLNLPRTCGYHDNENEGNNVMRGTIVIQ